MCGCVRTQVGVRRVGEVGGRRGEAVRRRGEVWCVRRRRGRRGVEVRT